MPDSTAQRASPSSQIKVSAKSFFFYLPVVQPFSAASSSASFNFSISKTKYSSAQASIRSIIWRDRSMGSICRLGICCAGMVRPKRTPVFPALTQASCHSEQAGAIATAPSRNLLFAFSPAKNATRTGRNSRNLLHFPIPIGKRKVYLSRQ